MFTISVYALNVSPGIVGTRIAQHIGNRRQTLETIGSYLLADDGAIVHGKNFNGMTGQLGIEAGKKQTLLKITKI